MSGVMLLLKSLMTFSCFSYCIALSSDVLELSDNDFSTRITEFDTSLVMFYAPWCGHCKKLKPEFDKAAGLIGETESTIVLAKVDCQEGGKKTCNDHSVTGYPTIKIFRNGEFHKEYDGPREAHGIAKHMLAQIGPSSKELSTIKALEDFISNAELSIVGCFEKESDLKGVFLKVADQLREKYRFGHSTNKEVLNKQGVKDAIILFRPKHLHNMFEDPFVTYSGPTTKEGVIKWIKQSSHGIVGHRTRENMGDFKNPLVVAYYAVDYTMNPKGTHYWRNRIIKVAKAYTDSFQFAISAKDDFQHELNEFGKDYVPGKKPIVFARSADNKKYSMKEEFTMEAFETFLNALQAGELEPYLKSEPVPEDNSAPVKVAVAKNFDEVVTNNGQDTLVEFYAPWCGHCKKLTPIYEELGEKLKDEDVAIVKMDASNNDVPSEYEVRGFPTIYWAPKDAKSKPVRYEGGREVDDFIKYIAQHSVSELKGYDRRGNAKAAKEEL